jgi:hypothetical protein
MSHFIGLTALDDNSEFIVTASAIKAVRRYSDGERVYGEYTNVLVDGVWLVVTETPERILELIEESGKAVMDEVYARSRSLSDRMAES